MINFTSIQLIDDLWVYTWATGPGEVRVVLWGVEIDRTSDTSYTYEESLYNSATIAPPLEVVSASLGELAISEYNRPYLVLQWYRVAGAAYYEIEYWNGTSWDPQGSVPDDPDTFIFLVTTPVLEDMTETQWRVVAVADTKRESDPLTIIYFATRPPNVPSLPELSCDGGLLTVQ